METRRDDEISSVGPVSIYVVLQSRIKKKMTMTADAV